MDGSEKVERCMSSLVVAGECNRATHIAQLRNWCNGLVTRLAFFGCDM